MLALLVGADFPGIEPLGGTGDGGRDAIIRTDANVRWNPHKALFGAPGAGLRRWESNPLPLGNEPSKLPLLYSASLDV